MAKSKKGLESGVNGTAVLEKPKHPRSVSSTLSKLRGSRMAKPNPIEGCTDDAADKLDEFPEQQAPLAEPVQNPVPNPVPAVLVPTPVTPELPFQSWLAEQAAKLTAAKDKAQAVAAASTAAASTAATTAMSPIVLWATLAFVACAIFGVGLTFGAEPAVSAVVTGVLLVVVGVLADVCRWIWKADAIVVVKGLVAVGTVIGLYVAIAATFGSYHWGWLLSSLVLYLVARDLKSLAFGGKRIAAQ